ncbi:MAG: hypothetical protein WCA16_17655 [Candidatus Sulfotelmatobacter sp.]
MVLDAEHSRLSDVQNLHQEFPALPIVCTQCGCKLHDHGDVHPDADWFAQLNSVRDRHGRW